MEGHIPKLLAIGPISLLSWEELGFEGFPNMLYEECWNGMTDIITFPLHDITISQSGHIYCSTWTGTVQAVAPDGSQDVLQQDHLDPV